ncbi:neo-calmodulin-like [Ylistrum balloti]|uniref:neo-calmodulin-like n=1 Tax=Ylistrum balloti TaxID=509963 RepID=UPI0029058561|nr:neo-calmodulin-like [Ylistrum balloti]
MKEVEFTEEQLEEYKAAFAMFDTDNSGSITIDEMMTVMTDLGQCPSAEELKEELEKMDINNDGSIEFHEFLSTLKKMASEEELKECFQLFDKEGNGYLTFTQLKRILQDLGKDSFTDEEIEELIEAGGLNVDGHLKYERIHSSGYKPTSAYMGASGYVYNKAVTWKRVGTFTSRLLHENTAYTPTGRSTPRDGYSLAGGFIPADDYTQAVDNQQ